MEITKYQKDLMTHTISDDGRNWFGTDYKTKDSKEFEDLVSKGFAKSHIAPCWYGDEVIYSLTEKGIAFLKESTEKSKKQEKISKSKQRYKRYLEYGDGFSSFVDFCYWDAEPERSWNGR